MKAKNLVLGLSATLLLVPVSYGYAQGVTQAHFDRAGAGLGKSGSQTSGPKTGWYSFSSHSGPFVSKGASPVNDRGRDDSERWNGNKRNDWSWNDWRFDPPKDRGNRCGHYKGYQGYNRHFSSNQGTSPKGCNKY